MEKQVIEIGDTVTVCGMDGVVCAISLGQCTFDVNGERVTMPLKWCALVRKKGVEAFPFRTKVCLHSSKDNMWDLGEQIGLKGDALGNFKYALHEVEFELDVLEDGSYSIVTVEGRKLERKKP